MEKQTRTISAQSDIIVTGELTEAKLKLITAKHGTPIRIEVVMDDKGKDIALGYFKKPGLQVFSIVMSTVDISADGKTTVKDFEKYTNVLIENCWLGGDERIKQDEMAAFGAATQLFSLIKPKAARIKNA